MLVNVSATFGVGKAASTDAIWNDSRFIVVALPFLKRGERVSLILCPRLESNKGPQNYEG
jgi:hypothetical protein